MKVGDLVARKADKTRLLGVIVSLYVIVNRFLHRDPLPMAKVATEYGISSWKRRKLEVISESR